MKMKELTKKQKLDFIIKHCNENDVTAYMIGKHTGLNTSGIDKILKGLTENPNNLTVNLIYDFLVNPDKFGIGMVEEPMENYSDISVLQKTVIDLQREMIELIKENAKLRTILEKNNIPF